MALNPTPDAIRAALRSYRADPDQFNADVRLRIEATDAQPADPLAGASPWLRSAAAFLPLPLVAGGTVTGAVTKMTGGFKIVSYLTLPAISLFVLFAAAIGSVTRINDIHGQHQPMFGDEAAVQNAFKTWWRRSQPIYWAIFGISLAMMFYGATWLLFLGLIGSFGVLLVMLNSLARRGLGTRQLIGQMCLMALMALGQVTAFVGLGDSELHFIDQKFLPVVCFLGIVLIGPTLVGDRFGLIGWRRNRFLPWAVLGVMLVILGPLGWTFLRPTLQPVTRADLKDHVESFQEAPFSSSSWHDWEIVARWTIEAGLKPDLSGPRRLFVQTSPTDPVYVFILTYASRIGLIRAEEFAWLPDYANERKRIFDDPHGSNRTQPLRNLNHQEWIIRGSVMNGRLTVAERDYLADRLHATLDGLDPETYEVLADAVQVTQLLAVIDRPVNPNRYRARIHGLLRALLSKQGGGFQVAGGFKSFAKQTTGSNDATEYALELMQTYGVPADLDMNWVRSFVRATGTRINDQWVIAVARERLNALPGVHPPTWFEILNAERSLVAIVILVGLCLFATWTAPRT